MWPTTRHCAEETMIALLDGELSPADCVAAERHLAGCARCAALLARERRASAALAAMMMEHLSGIVVASRSERRLGVPVAGAGLLVGSAGALLVAGILLRRHRRHAASSALGVQ